MYILKNILQTFTILFFLTLSNTSFSQVNIETIRNDKKNKELSFEISGGADIKVGNVDILKINSSLLTHYFYKNNHIFLKAEYSWGQQNSQEFENSSFAHLRLTKMLNNLIGFEIFSQIQDDKFKNLKIRQLNGLGIRFEIFKNKSTLLSLGIGGMSDYEKINLLNQSEIVIRGTSYLSFYKLLGEDNLFSVTSYVQPHIINPEDFRINIEGLIRLKLIKDINIFIDNSFNYQHDAKPPESVQLNDFSTQIKLTYKW